MNNETRADALAAIQEATIELRRCHEQLDALLPLCHCQPWDCARSGYCTDDGPCGGDGREQDCPVHGDGTSFVAYVRQVEASAAAASGFVGAVDRARELDMPPMLGPVLTPFMQLRAAVEDLGGKR